MPRTTTKRGQTPEELAEYEQQQLNELFVTLKDFARDLEEYEELSTDLPCKEATEGISSAVAALQSACDAIKGHNQTQSRKKASS